MAGPTCTLQLEPGNWGEGLEQNWGSVPAAELVSSLGQRVMQETTPASSSSTSIQHDQFTTISVVFSSRRMTQGWRGSRAKRGRGETYLLYCRFSILHSNIPLSLRVASFDYFRSRLIDVNTGNRFF